MRELIIKSPNKQCIADPLPTGMIKECLGVLLPFITHIINLSLQSGSFAGVWKEAFIIPLLKKVGLDIISPNFRPVSNLSFISKMAERASVKQISSHMNLHCPLPALQSAYKEYHSTETALLKVLSDIRLDIDAQKVTLLVMLDLSAAFDTIDHAILLEILKKKVGLSGTALQWVQSYISNRYQCVQVKGKLSKRTELEYGVPQGSCLGPILFLIYASLLFDVMAKHLPNAHGYADDHQIYLSFKPTDQVSQEDALQSIQDCISDVRKWMLANKLKINDGKTEFMMIGSKHNLNKLNINSIKIGDTEIKPVTSLRNLGAMIDENLSMEHQITKTCSTAFYHIRNIRHIRKYLDVKSTETMVHAFITNKLDYCNSLLYGLPDCQIQKLQRVQNAAARIITGMEKYDHITPALKELHWLPVQRRIEFKILLLTYKALNNMAPSYITSMFTMQAQERYSLRSNTSLQLKIPRTKYKTCGDRAFPVAAATLWNRLPYNIRDSQSIDTIKSRLKTFLFSIAFGL